MCGIVGFWNVSGESVDPVMLDSFTDRLAHRGPDGRGTHVDAAARLGLGHRRLSILDVSESGRQPMSYADERYWITYNGEIYNFLELREELVGCGHSFRSESDTEVILAAYAQWGEACQLRFNGMWAFAVWDQRERQLFLSRDRFGVKPLHYYSDGRHFAFASEMKAFLALPWFPAEIDPVILASALMEPHDIEGTEDCLFKGLKRLPGGHCLTLPSGKQPVVRRWWSTLDHLTPVPRAFADQAERFREIFVDACRIRMRSDVAIGTSLSGGLDSSSVLCCLAQARAGSAALARSARDWQRAFIATYPGTNQDERRYAEEVVRHSGAVPCFIEIDPAGVADQLDAIAYQFEEIYADLAVGPWQVYREQRRQGVVVSLDGHGGDEVLGGYHHYLVESMGDAWRMGPRFFRYRDLQRTLRNMYEEGHPVSAPSFAGLFRNTWWPDQKHRQRAWRHRQTGRAVRMLKRWPSAYGRLKKSFGRADGDGAEDLPPSLDPWIRIRPRAPQYAGLEADRPRLQGRNHLFRTLYYDTHFGSLTTILRNFERCSMGHGVEVRTPFLDWRLVTYAFSLPPESLMGGGFSKRVLREAMRGILPESIRTRTTKVGFTNPLHDWLAGPLRPLLLDAVSADSFLQSEIWNGPYIRTQVERGYANRDADLLRRALSFAQADRLMRVLRPRAVHPARPCTHRPGGGSG